MSTEKATENSGFLDGRDYTAAFVYEFCALLVGNGVYAGELAPTATNDNMTITHGSGHAWINGVCYKNTTPFALDIAKADGALNRYDSLMLRLDLSANETYAIIVQGEYATAPTPPACTRNAEIYDLKICDIYVPAGCTKITQDLITDTRMDASVCGVPVFPVDHLDLTTFYKQVAADLANFRAREQADFAAWVTGQEESHLATMHDLVEIVRMTSDNSVAEILELLRQLNELVEGDTVGELITAINEKLPKTGGTMTGNLAMGAHRITDLAEPEDGGDAATKGYTDDSIEKLLKKSGGIMTGEINMNGQPITGMNPPTETTQAANKGYVDTAVRKAAPVNLLDNSDFRNPVNQRGQTSYGTEGYTIDRWIMLVDIGVINVVHGGLNLDAANHAITFAQYLDDGTLASMVASGKKYTVAINYTVNTVGGDANLFERPKNGGVNRAFAFETGLGNHTSFASFTPDATGGNFQYAPVWMYLSQGWNVTLHWIALYEGEYTAETLPEYRPKGYMVEALNCGGVSMANSVVMEYSLGTSFTDEQSADIRSGKFEKVHVGGYWTINGRKYWAAHADYRLHCGDTELTTHHMLVIPEKSLLNMNWNGTNDTTGGYVSSKVKTEGMAQALEIVKGDFGADHILNHRIILTNAVSNGASSGWAWYDSQIDLMNEHMVYGSHAWGGGSQNGYDTGADKSQLALFQARPDLITNRETWWLRDVYSASHPCLVEDKGTTSARGASDSIGVRPAFLIY